MRQYKWILFLICLTFSLATKAQYSFTFMPEVQGRSIDGLMMVKINYMGTSAASIQLRVTVSEAKQGQLLVLTTPVFTMYPGVSVPLPGLVHHSAIEFGQQEAARLIRQANIFPGGEYEYCFQILEQGEGTGSQEQCFDYHLQPFSPLLLSEPFEEEDIQQLKPTFTWQPIFPAIVGIQYRLVIAEIKPGQDKVEAMHYNMAIVNQWQLQGPIYFYPPNARDLQPGKSYAWQVFAYKYDVILSASEVWEFKVAPFAEDIAATVALGNIDRYADETPLLISDSLTFGFDNSAGSQKLDYVLNCISDVNLQVNYHPDYPLNNGYNYIQFSFAGVKGMKKGALYELVVKSTQGGEIKKIRFVYK